MGLVIDAVRARVVLLAIVNAVCLVLSSLGKISQDTLGLWTHTVGQIFDYMVMIFGLLALLFPGILKYLQINKDVAKIGVFVMLMALPSIMAGCKSSADGTNKDTPTMTGKLCAFGICLEPQPAAPVSTYDPTNGTVAADRALTVAKSDKPDKPLEK